MYTKQAVYNLSVSDSTVLGSKREFAFNLFYGDLATSLARVLNDSVCQDKVC